MNGVPDLNPEETSSALSSVLVVTAHRPAEVIEPVKRMPIRTEILTLDAGVGPIERISSAARETRNAIHYSSSL